MNRDLEFTIEKEKDFENTKLPALGFELGSTKESVRHSYFEKPMRSQVLNEKRSCQSENQRFAILTNELHRRMPLACLLYRRMPLACSFACLRASPYQMRLL